MKILYIHQHFNTPAGASGIRSYEMAKKLIAEGHDVTILCGSLGAGSTGLSGPYHRGCRKGVVEGINVIEYELPYSNSLGLVRRSWLFLRFALRTSSHALLGPYDLVFATTTPLTVAIPALVGKWLGRKRFVFEVRDLWPELPKAMGVITNPIVLSMMSALEWAGYRSADHCVALAPGIADGIAKRGVPRERISIIPNGCDLELFDRNVVRPWRPEGVNDSDTLAVFTGSHGQANGLDAVLDVAKELSDRGRRDIKIVLIGDGKLKPGLQARAKSEQLDQVLFLDPVSKERLAQLLAGADVGMQILANIPAFYFGTSPNKFFDYLASGLPVLNNYPGWLAEMIREHDCGLAVDPENASQFADALIELAEHPERRREMGQHARQLAEQRFSRHELADRLVDQLSRIPIA